MPPCNISYIPSHLHQGDKPTIDHFDDGEKLYWRLGKNAPLAPYSSISLYDVSCNRSGSDNAISTDKDVLWNIESNAALQKYNSLVVSILIRKIYDKNPTIRIIRYPEHDGAVDYKSVTMTLIHSPLPCNYAHCMFVFDLNEERVTQVNYKDTFDKTIYKRLRNICRDILNKAIIQNEITF